MYVLTTKNSVADRAIAALVATSMVLWGVGAHITAEAASLIEVSDLLSDSAPNVLSDHTISFTVPAGSPGVNLDNDTIVVTMPAGFDFGAVVFSDMDLAVNGVDEGPGDWTYGRAGQVMTFTSAGGRVTAGEVFTIEIGVVAGGVNRIQNVNAIGSHQIQVQIVDITTTAVQDSAETVIVTVDNVTVSADVDATFDFFVSGLLAAETVNGDTTTQDSSTTTVPFGTLSPGSAEVVGQELRVITNAVNGYSVTVETDQQLTSSNLADIDSFTNGTGLASAASVVWAAPTGVINSENTYGHWGMTSEDQSLESGDAYGASLYSAVLTTPQEVMWHNSVTDGLVAHEGQTRVAFRAQVTSFQEAADDYTATLTYIATPTF